MRWSQVGIYVIGWENNILKGWKNYIFEGWKNKILRDFYLRDFWILTINF
jgi:hypothetical protein